jgi:hypothetical protein
VNDVLSESFPVIFLGVDELREETADVCALLRLKKRACTGGWEKSLKKPTTTTPFLVVGHGGEEIVPSH